MGGQVQGGPEQQVIEPVNMQQMKVAWGKMWTVQTVPCPGGTTEYCSFRREAQEGDGGNAVERAHTIPTMLRVVPNTQPFQYAAMLRDVQSTCVRGEIPVQQNAAAVSVFIPYRPMGRHG